VSTRLAEQSCGVLESCADSLSAAVLALLDNLCRMPATFLRQAYSGMNFAVTG